MIDPLNTAHAPPSDEGLRCLQCDYNLTGLTASVCPECGTTIDWGRVRAIRDAIHNQEAALPGTFWDSWPGYLKPLGFLATALQAALRPRRFAAQLPMCPRLGWALLFAGICVVWLLVGASVALDSTLSAVGWCAAVCFHLFVQAKLLSILLRPAGMRDPARFWLTVSCYTSYPLLLEVFAQEPPLIIGDANIWPVTLLSYTDVNVLLAWPATLILHEEMNVLLTVLYHLWWIGLLVIALTRMPRTSRWRVVPVVMGVLFASTLATYCLVVLVGVMLTAAVGWAAGH